MKKENQFIYYGIVFLSLYETIFRICERLISTIVLYFSWNIYIIPISLIVIAAVMIFIFNRSKFIITIKPWVFIVIIIAFLGITFIAPEKWLGSSKYSPSEVEILSLKTIINGGFTWIIVIIAYIKYNMLNKRSN